MAQVQSNRLAVSPWAVATPLLCAAHCLAAPLFLLVAPALAESTALELAMLGASAVLALALVRSGFRQHGERRVWWAAGVGLGVWIAAFAGVPGPGEPAGTLMGGVILSLALLWNARLTHAVSCRSCASAR